MYRAIADIHPETKLPIVCGMQHQYRKALGKPFSHLCHVNILPIAYQEKIIYGMIDALQPAVGYNWGARSLGRVKALEKCCFVVAAAFGVVGFVVIRLFPELMVQLFLPSADADFIVLAVHALGLFSFSMLLKWFSFATQSFMIAVGQVRLASFVSVAMVCIFPLAALFALWPLGLDGLWLNSVVTYALCTAMSAFVLLRFRRTVHERLDRA